jgi:protein-tyrosine-phosphatase
VAVSGQEISLGLVILAMKRVLFICNHNSGRSQMAAAFFNEMAKGKATAASAGTQPAPQINPTVVTAMREVGIDISQKKPQLLTKEMLEDTDWVITMGCIDSATCPVSFVPTKDWDLTDPEGRPLVAVRRLRDRIKNKVAALVGELDTS